MINVALSKDAPRAGKIAAAPQRLNIVESQVGAAGMPRQGSRQFVGSQFDESATEVLDAFPGRRRFGSDAGGEGDGAQRIVERSAA
jgi:hypothetical protein